jgi:hypothetical protein
LLCPEVNSCTWHPTVTELTLDIDGWHSMRVAHYNVAGVPHCETVEVEWDYTTTMYRTGLGNTWADNPVLMPIGLGNCDSCEYDLRRWHELVSIDCDPPLQECQFPSSGYNSGSTFTTYRGFPAASDSWNHLTPFPDCDLDPQSATLSASSPPQIVGTAVRKLYNLSTSTLVTTQSVSIARNARAVITCVFSKSSCLSGAHLRMIMFIGRSGAPSGFQWFAPEEMGLHLVTFPPLPFGSFFNTYNLGFSEAPGEQQDGFMTLVAPISGTAFPTGFDFIERSNASKTICCQPFGETDCNDGVIECTTNPSEKFQRCLAPYGTSVNLWYCYRKPTVTVNVV